MRSSNLDQPVHTHSLKGVLSVRFWALDAYSVTREIWSDCENVKDNLNFQRAHMAVYRAPVPLILHLIFIFTLKWLFTSGYFRNDHSPEYSSRY